MLREKVEDLSALIGFDVPTLNITLGLFLCYPLAAIMNILPYGPIRHFASFFFGLFLLQFVVGVQWVHQLITSLVVYALFVILPRRINVWVVPTFVLTYCALGHLHRQYVNYLGWDLDFTSSQMVITQKLYMMAYNLYDAEVLSCGKSDRASKKCQEFSLVALPNLLEFLGYTFCFSCVLGGPAYEFSLYKRGCDGTHMYDEQGKPKGKIPSNVIPTLIPLLKCLGTLIVYVVVGGAFPLLDTVDPQKNTPTILRPDFLMKPWLYRYMYQWCGLLAVRMKYYFAWTCAEGATNMWYAGFDGFDESGTALGWTTAQNLDILKFETAENVQTMSKEWNKKTSLWLTRYVYIRTNGNLLLVYGTSAIWHGFYPGYYMFFLSVPLLTMCERLVKKKISPYFPQAKWSPYGIVGILVTSLFVEYMVIPFVLLARDRSFACYKAHGFFGHILPIMFLLIAPLMPKPKIEKKE
jgi:MBOAT, membrane-bound O-acyltransferase family